MYRKKWLLNFGYTQLNNSTNPINPTNPVKPKFFIVVPDDWGATH
jgi:hypothetical protein